MQCADCTLLFRGPNSHKKHIAEPAEGLKIWGQSANLTISNTRAFDGTDFACNSDKICGGGGGGIPLPQHLPSSSAGPVV